MEAAEYSCVIDVLKMHYEFFELLWYCTRGSEFVDYIFLEEVREYVAFQWNRMEGVACFLFDFWYIALKFGKWLVMELEYCEMLIEEW